MFEIKARSWLNDEYRLILAFLRYKGYTESRHIKLTFNTLQEINCLIYFNGDIVAESFDELYNHFLIKKENKKWKQSI